MLAQEAEHVGHHVLVAIRVLQALLRGRARVHDHERRARPRAHLRKRGVPQAGDVVDDHGAGLDRRLGDGGLVRVHRHDGAEVVHQPPHEGHDALELLVDLDGRPVRDARLAADVEPVGAVGEQAPGMRDARVERAVDAAVGERVRRGVDDAHEQRPRAQGDRASTGAQRERARGHAQPTRTVRVTAVALPALSVALKRIVCRPAPRRRRTLRAVTARPPSKLIRVYFTPEALSRATAVARTTRPEREIRPVSLGGRPSMRSRRVAVAVA